MLTIGQTLKSNPPVKVLDFADGGRSVQELVCRYLSEIVLAWEPKEVLREFRSLFFVGKGAKNTKILQTLHSLIRNDRENEFNASLKRACYLLLLAWDKTQPNPAVSGLVKLFCDPILECKTASLLLQRHRKWLQSFANSSDYSDLKLLESGAQLKKPQAQLRHGWSDRYLAYQLVPLFANPNNPDEQRELARVVSQRLKDRFKFDLAMYVARSQSMGYDDQMYPNPTLFGNGVLRLIKIVAAGSGDLCSPTFAKGFLQQTQNVSYQEFKTSLLKYILVSTTEQTIASTFQTQLSNQLITLYTNKNEAEIDEALRFRTCNRVIEMLTTENQREPSSLFKLLMDRGYLLTLTIALLKLTLISPRSRIHLELRIADLIRYYKQFSTQENREAIHFFEMLKIVFAMSSNEVEYSLVKLQPEASKSSSAFDPESYKIFARLKADVQDVIN